MLDIGSEWCLWDLHIHTPASFHWNGARFASMNAAQEHQALDAMVDAMNVSSVEVFGIQDYWTFEGYDRLQKHATAFGRLTKRVLPGIELRIEAPTDFRLNFHVLFSDTVQAERRQEFFSRLKMPGTGNPPHVPGLTECARRLDRGKLLHHGYRSEDVSDDAKMLELGSKVALVTRESVAEALKNFDRTDYLIIQPYDTSDGLVGLDWKEHSYLDHHFSELADVFETRHPRNVDLFLGRRNETNSSFIDAFLHNIGGYPKPVVSGSDAHSVAAYGVFPNGRATWIKGAPDFRTLLQAKADPVSRCHIGGEPEQVRRQREHSTKYITSITIKPSTDAPPGESWFDQTVPVNSGLVAIIGNKGSGKSALADAIALAGNAHSERLSFLTSERFRRPPNRSGHYQATLTWLSGEADTVSLGSDYVPGKPERLRYLPQDYIEEICNSLDATVDSPFERALRQVIFLHLSTETRRQSEDLAAVIDRLDADVGEKLRHLRSELHALNRRIIALEQATAADTIAALEQQITLKQQEIDALLAPEVVPEPVLDDQGEKDQARVSQIRAALAEIDGADATATGAKSEQLARLTNIEELLRLLREFQTTVGRLAARINEVAQRVGLSGGDLVSYSVTNQQVEQLRNATVDEIASLTSLLESEESHSVPNRRKIAHDELTALLGRISGPHERYQAYLSAQRQLDALRTSLVGTPEIAGSLSSLRAQLDRARTALPQELNSLRLDRLSFAREIHAVIRGKGETLRGLFVPVQARIDQEDVASELGFEFAVAFSLETLESTFFTLINQRSRGRFMEKDEGLREFRAILSPYALATEAGALSFIKGIVDALDDGAAANIDRQLRKGVERIQVYDFLFGLSYIQPYFTLRLNGKELHLLSPGERGALLLMFYLLLDPDDTPLLIDQPEQNLDNETVFRVLVPCFKRARSRRQLIMVTHNPNLAVVCDADQVIRATFLREEEHVRYEAGPLEAPDIAKQAVDVLEGTLPAFRSRRQRYTYSGQS